MSRVEHEDVFSQGKDFFAAVRYIKNGNAMRAIPLAQIVNDRSLGRAIKRGQRLVEQENFRIGDERAGQSNTLALAAGNFASLAPREMRNTERLEDRRDAGFPLGPRLSRQAIADVLRDGQMWKQCKALKDISGTAFRDWNIDMLRRIEQHAPAEHDLTRIRRHESSDAIEQRGLARARGSEENGKTGRAREIHIQNEFVRGFPFPCRMALANPHRKRRVSSGHLLRWNRISRKRLSIRHCRYFRGLRPPESVRHGFYLKKIFYLKEDQLS